jgi:hypothetical protein
MLGDPRLHRTFLSQAAGARLYHIHPWEATPLITALFLLFQTMMRSSQVNRA